MTAARSSRAGRRAAGLSSRANLSVYAARSTIANAAGTWIKRGDAEHVLPVAVKRSRAERADEENESEAA
jgi:hypothetical protein